MEEKIKISIPSSTYQILIKDAQLFDFCKSENQINRNLFINTLINNYYEEFSNDENTFHDDLKKLLVNIDYKSKEDLFDNIISLLNKKSQLKIKADKTVSLSFKPIKISKNAIEYINNVLINNESISSYYRRLLNSYIHKPLNERELIIFKDTYALLMKSIKSDVKVCLFLKNGNIIKNISVYAVCSSSDELYNYILGIDENNKLYTIKLYKINNVTLTPHRRIIVDKVRKIFDRQIKCGVQYPIYFDDDAEIIVKLTDKGKDLLKKIYLYRPNILKIQGDLYFFNCSYAQITHYFKRFGKEAIIISPENLTYELIGFYSKAKKQYMNYIQSIKKEDK